jgi:hypothetical protein
VLQAVIDQARTAHPQDLYERNLYCLIHWCRSLGPDATKQVLKDTLVKNGCRNLACMIDNIDQQADTVTEFTAAGDDVMVTTAATPSS